MTTQNRTKTVLTLAFVAMAFLALTAGSANAQVTVTPDHISTDPGVQSTLLAIDVPYSASLPFTGGPDWPEDADDGFLVVNHAVQESWTNGKWEPDGTPQAENRAYQVYPNASPNVTYTFDIPDGAIIYAVYATWATRAKLYARYHYGEGAASDSLDVVQSVNPTDRPRPGLDGRCERGKDSTVPTSLQWSDHRDRRRWVHSGGEQIYSQRSEHRRGGDRR